MTGSRRVCILFVLALLAVLALAVGPLIGMRTIPLDAVMHSSSWSKESEIFWRLRVPRVFVSFLGGIGLAVSGMSFQALFRNPLATPFTLGVSSGAALGAAAYIRFGLPAALLGIPGISLSAFIGAMFSILLVYGLTQLRSGFSTGTMLLAGVAISFFFSSVNLFIQYISDFTQTFHLIRWLMGGLEVVGFRSVLNMLPFVVVGVIIIL